MKEFLSQKGIIFEDLNVAEDPIALDRLEDIAGAPVVPVVLINGQAVIGYDRDKLEKILH